MPLWVLVAHLASVACLAGVGWIAQLALYPLFARVGAAEWSGYHDAHSRALGQVVALPWVVQGATTVALLIRQPSGVPFWLVLLDGFLAAGPVAVTALVAVPLHRRLASAPLAELVDALLRANLVRTVAWTVSVVLGSALVILAG